MKSAEKLNFQNMIRLKGIYVFEALCSFVPNEHLNLGFGGGEVDEGKAVLLDGLNHFLHLQVL